MLDLVTRPVGLLTVTIDRSRCIGTANCVRIAPELFELDETNTVAFRPDAAPIEADRVIEACDACPVDALTVRDEKGAQLVP